MQLAHGHYLSKQLLHIQSCLGGKMRINYVIEFFAHSFNTPDTYIRFPNFCTTFLASKQTATTILMLE